ncbi:MAG: hypothetical protein OEW00_06240 [candidate division Zixibacteria bacterium]|nr:hypothetical protein [candidate division Zixibacteria bacterium]
MRKWFVLHPYLFGLFPVLFLFAQNADQMPINDTVVPALAVLAFVLLTTLLLNLLLKNINKAGLIISVFLLVFFSYGHLVDLVRGLHFEFDQFDDTVNGVLLGGLSLMLVAVIFFTLRAAGSLPRLTRLLNIVAVMLVLLQVAAGGYAVAGRSSVALDRPEIAVTGDSPDKLPNIYYIVVDGYARHDILKEIFHYDNSEFLEHLRDKGFFVADSSYANYTQTMQTLASSLNMNFLHALGKFDKTTKDRLPLIKLFRDNVLFKTLRERGYTLVNFVSGFDMTELDDADITLNPAGSPSEFQGLLLLTTPLPYIMHGLKSPFDLHRDRVLKTLEKLPHITEAEPPYFVFAHIVSPHPPFLFDQEGNTHERSRRYDHGDGSHYIRDGGNTREYLVGYHNQVKVVTGLLQETIDGILENSADDPPVIILQADHGSGARLDWSSVRRTYIKERFSILNAFYLPGLDSLPVYPSITPVNTFRLILNAYFGTNYEKLPDESIYSPWYRPYIFQRVTEQLRGKEFPRDIRELIQNTERGW